jgi:hypothetical protein
MDRFCNLALGVGARPVDQVHEGVRGSFLPTPTASDQPTTAQVTSLPTPTGDDPLISQPPTTGYEPV